eukprot:190188-Pelagomonas_calceolata.AAC.2
MHAAGLDACMQAKEDAERERERERENERQRAAAAAAKAQLIAQLPWQSKPPVQALRDHKKFQNGQQPGSLADQALASAKPPVQASRESQEGLQPGIWLIGR